MEYRLSKLENGIKVLTAPMLDRESVSVGVWVRAGSRFETAKISGVSHFLEHMLFKGTARRSTRQIKEAIEGVGGVLNAFTSEEVTCYFAKLLKEHAGRALDVLSDMIHHARLDPADMEKERDVIIEEIKMYRDLPSHEVQEMLSRLVWPGQALGRSLSGTEKTVAALTRKELYDYWKKYYHPRNIVVSAAGPVTHEAFVEQVRKYFPRKESLPASRFRPLHSKPDVSRVLVSGKKTEQTHLVIGIPTFSRYHADRFVLALLHIILGGNMSSRLFEELREKRGLAYEIRSGLSFFQDTGLLTISAGVEASKALRAVELILAELSRMMRSGVRESELARAKDYYLSQLTMGLEDTLDHMLWVGERAVYRDELPNRLVMRRGVEAVTCEGICHLARKLFMKGRRHLALIGPVPEKEQQKMTRKFLAPLGPGRKK